MKKFKSLLKEIENEENKPFDVVTYTFMENIVPISKKKNVYLYDFIKIIEDNEIGETIALGEVQSGVSIYVRNRLDINDNVMVPDLFEWKSKDIEGKWSQFKTLVLDKLNIDEEQYEEAYEDENDETI